MAFWRRRAEGEGDYGSLLRRRGGEEGPHGLEGEERGHFSKHWKKYAVGLATAGLLSLAGWLATDFSKRVRKPTPPTPPAVTAPAPEAKKPDFYQPIPPQKAPEVTGPPAVPAPAEEYVQKVHVVRHGDVLWRIVKNNYGFANKQKVNEVVAANPHLPHLQADNRAVVTVGYATRRKLDIVSFLPQGKSSYSDNDLAVVVMKDDIKGDLIKLGDRIILPGLKEKVTKNPQKTSALEGQVRNIYAGGNEYTVVFSNDGKAPIVYAKGSNNPQYMAGAKQQNTLEHIAKEQRHDEVAADGRKVVVLQNNPQYMGKRVARAIQTASAQPYNKPVVPLDSVVNGRKVVMLQNNPYYMRRAA